MDQGNWKSAFLQEVGQRSVFAGTFRSRPYRVLRSPS